MLTSLVTIKAATRMNKKVVKIIFLYVGRVTYLMVINTDTSNIHCH